MNIKEKIPSALLFFLQEKNNKEKRMRNFVKSGNKWEKTSTKSRNDTRTTHESWTFFPFTLFEFSSLFEASSRSVEDLFCGITTKKRRGSKWRLVITTALVKLSVSKTLSFSKWRFLRVKVMKKVFLSVKHELECKVLWLRVIVRVLDSIHHASLTRS